MKTIEPCRGLLADGSDGCGDGSCDNATGGCARVESLIDEIAQEMTQTILLSDAPPEWVALLEHYSETRRAYYHSASRDEKIMQCLWALGLMYYDRVTPLGVALLEEARKK